MTARDRQRCGELMLNPEPLAGRGRRVFARESWRAEKVHNGPPGDGFHLVRGWIENHAQIEIGDSEMRTQYERFFAEMTRAAVQLPEVSRLD
jgi:hypothetical protein